MNDQLQGDTGSRGPSSESSLAFGHRTRPHHTQCSCAEPVGTLCPPVTARELTHEMSSHNAHTLTAMVC